MTAKLADLLHRCTLALEDGDAFDAYRRAVARSGGDGQVRCWWPAREWFGYLPERCMRWHKEWRCDEMASAVGRSLCVGLAPELIISAMIQAGADRDYVDQLFGEGGRFFDAFPPHRGAIYCDNRMNQGEGARVTSYRAARCRPHLASPRH